MYMYIYIYMCIYIYIYIYVYVSPLLCALILLETIFYLILSTNIALDPTALNE